MKKGLLSIMTIFLLITPIFSVSAHPGRTAADGKHYCRTNCDYWGVPWNERHSHGGSSSKSTNSNINKSYSKPKSTPAKPIIVYKIITALQETSVYSKPSIESQNVLFTLPYGTEIKDIGGTYGWKTIKHTDGTFVYISNKHTTMYIPNEGQLTLLEVKSEKGYIFTAPSINSNVINSLEQGTLITVVGNYEDWYYIVATNSNGVEVKGFIKNTVVGSM